MGAYGGLTWNPPIPEEDSLIVVGITCLAHSPFPSNLGTRDCHPPKLTSSKVPFSVSLRPLITDSSCLLEGDSPGPFTEVDTQGKGPPQVGS